MSILKVLLRLNHLLNKRIKSNSLLFLCLLGLLTQSKLSGQNRPEGQITLTPNGIFDEVADRFGQKYQLADISVGSSRPFGNATTNSVPSQSCNAGYFRLFLAPGSALSQNSTAQTVLCGLFTD